MRIEKIVKIKNLFQGLKFDKLYTGRNAKVLSQTNGKLVFETYLYFEHMKNITYKIKVKAVLNVPNGVLIQTYENRAILNDGIMYMDCLDIIPISSVQNIKNEQFLKI